MAMLQREKKPSSSVSASACVTEQEPAVPEPVDNITDDPILENLSKEPVDYENTCCLSAPVVESLQSVKHICLCVLDLLLLQIVRNLHSKHARRLSDPSAATEPPPHQPKNLLGSITQNTNLLQELSSTSMARSKSSPPATSISDVYRILDAHPQRQFNAQDYTLSCSLAALLNDVYRLLELNSSQQQQELVKTEQEDDVNLLQQELHDQVSVFQRKRAEGIMSIDEADASQEMIMLWDEMDHLMNIVCKLAVQQQQQQQQDPPAYNAHHETFSTTKDALHADDDDEHDSTPFTPPPPAYHSITPHGFSIKEEKTGEPATGSAGDLDQLLDAIDRLSHVAPRLNNQRVDLTEKQVKELAAATLGKTVQRLSRGRMEDQRAPLPKHQVLQDLVQQIQKSASRSLDNQRVALNADQRKKMEFASIHGVLKRLDKGRYADQDWISHEEHLINDLRHTTDLLVKSLDRPAYHRQRFSLSAAKERTLFMSGLFNKVESLEGCRLVNQDAELSSKAAGGAADDNEDLQQLLNNIYKSTKPQLDNQRASFTL
ncbi:uncharacterized protein ATC70_004995 [Mucor velutinosus]|uniref:Uncharacterized protein n=1 Tax=Mucor velutinosus TaxID=708070 RepID=A0AAN7D561_9FUNG|nr:hypothetical protein ATC70_004995 [Mucor velutinosus]